MVTGVPFLTEGPVTASLTVFFLLGDFRLCPRERFNPTTGDAPRRMASDREWRPRQEDLFLSDGAPKGVIV